MLPEVCPDCGYYLTAVLDDFCPNCGHLFEDKSAEGANSDPEVPLAVAVTPNVPMAAPVSEPNVPLASPVTPDQRSRIRQDEHDVERKLRRFHLVSRFACTVGLSVLLAVASWFDGRPHALAAHLLGMAIVAVYLQVPYGIYDGHVNRGQKPGCALQLIFLLLTGLFGGIILMLIWDFLRFIQAKITNPPGRINYCVNTPGFLFS